MILWSHGRSASDALAGTLKASANFSYCNGLKEGFGNKHDSSLISKKALGRVPRPRRDADARDARLPGQAGQRAGDAKSLLPGGPRPGFQGRRGGLARERFSKAGLVLRTDGGARAGTERSGRARALLRRDLTQQIEDLTRAYRDGVNAARDAGLAVVERMFDEVVSDLCGTVAAVTDELEDEFRGSSCRPFRRA